MFISDPHPEFKSDPLDAALAYAVSHGLAIFAAGQDKAPQPGLRWTQEATTDCRQLTRWWKHDPKAMIGLPAGKGSSAYFVDVDPRNGGLETLARLQQELGPLPIDTPRARTAGGGFHVHLLWIGGAAIPKRTLGPGVDLIGCTAEGEARGYVIMPGSVRGDGCSYEWEQPPADYKLALKPAPAKWIEHIGAIATSRSHLNGSALAGPASNDADALADLEREKSELATTPKGGGQHGGRNTGLNVAACKLGHHVPHRLSRAGVEAALHEACAANGLITDKGEDNFAKTFASGLKKGMREPSAPRSSIQADFGDIPATDDGTNKKQPISHDALALRFSERYEHDLRFINLWGQWLLWDGTRWKAETTLWAFDLARSLAREQAAGLRRAQAKEICSSPTVSAIERLARADRRHASSADVWDADPWLLSTPDGTVDLRTGTMREHRRGDLMTKTTTVGPRGDCPLWLKFLDQIFRSDQELIAFVQRVLGYTLTGLTREHALFFGYGLGGNGKGVLLNTWLGIMGDYAVTAPMKTFTESRHERHLTELAMLRGARAVIAQEVEAGARWAEVRVKALTGGDPITANFMRQDHFTYVPQFKLLMAGNHKPMLGDVNEAMRRRLHFIPFDVTVSKVDRDPRLPEKLRQEWPGILRWAIQGCLDWQQFGLTPPQAVRAATEVYFLEQDAMARFVGECCMTDDPNAVEKTDDLYSAWWDWCQTDGTLRTSTKVFSQKIEARGFKRSTDPETRRSRFHGVRLIRAGMWF